MNITKYAGVALIALSIAGTAHANTPVQADIQAKAAEKVELRKEKIASSTAALKAKTIEKIAKAAQEATRKYNKTLGQLLDVRVRIETKMAKIEAAGGSATATRASLAASDEKLAKVRADITAVSTVTVPDVNPRAAIDTLKERMKQVELSMREYKTALLTALATLNRK